MKRPWLAALLNAWPLPLGIGYLYLRQWARFFVFFFLLQIVAVTFVRLLFGLEVRSVFVGVVWIAAILDGYLLAKSMNAALEGAPGTTPPKEEPQQVDALNQLSLGNQPSQPSNPQPAADSADSDARATAGGLSSAKDLPSLPQRKRASPAVIALLVACLSLPPALACGAASMYFWLRGCNPPSPPVEVRVTRPETAYEGETITVKVEIENTGEDPQLLHSIEIGEEYARGIAIRGSEPTFVRSTHDVGGSYGFEFLQNIPARETLVVSFEAVAAEAGDFSTGLRVCIETANNCLTHEMRTVVQEATATPTRTHTPTATPTHTPTFTATPSHTATPTDTPIPPPTATPRRLATGTLIKQEMTRDGQGELAIDNGNDMDSVAVLTGIHGIRILAVYVAAHSQFAVTGIPDGTYYLYFTLGEDWDSTSASFTRRVSFLQFEDSFPFETTATQYRVWDVTLHPVVGGTAETAPISEEEFPDLR